MKKITLLILLLFSVFELNAQIWTINSCSNLGSTTYGPMYSTATANANNRTAVIYPSSQLVTLAGQTLNSIYFNRTSTTGTMAGTPNFKVYMKEVSETDFGSTALDWTTGITGATLVYDSNPAAAVGTDVGWKEFEFTTNFLYSGTQNLAVFYEYVNTTASSSISWSYEYTAPCSDISNSNTTKYNNNTTGTLAASLSSTNYRRPLIGFDFVVTCPAPLALTVSNITTNSANVSWSQGGTETAWEYAIQPAGTGIPSSPISTTSTTVNPTTLMSNTNYEIYVRSNCGGTDGDSYWIGPVNFKTLCDDVAAFVENFDAWPTGSAAGMPDCWSKLGTGNTYLTTASNTPMSAPNRLYMNISATTDVYAVMPPVSNLQANTHRLRFKVYCTTANKTLRVGYFTDATDSSTFVELQSFTMPSTTLASTLEFEVVPTTVPSGVNQLVFSITPGTSTTAYIDDVKWELNSSCVEPNTLTASFITNNSATLGWTPGGTETLWDIQYGEPNFALGSGTFVNDVNSNPYLLSGLLGNTSYQYYVRTKCSGSNSSWSGPYTFKTQCDYVTEFVENFDSYPTGTTSLPDCWARGGTSTSTYITTGGAAPMSPANRLYMFASGTTPTEGYAILPGVSNLAANTHRLKFKAYATVAGRTLEVGYLTDPSDVATFIQLQEITLPGTALASTEEFTIVPGALPAGIYHLCIKNPGFPSASTTAYIDDVKWEAIPTCVEPNTLTSNLITNNTAQINWVEGNTATAWEIEYGPVGFVQGSVDGTIVAAPTNPFTLTTLLANTSYDYYVRAVCSTSDSSPWTGPSTFKTLCDDVTEFYEPFEGYATGSANPLADCWNKGGNGLVYLTTGSVAPMSPTIRLYMTASGTATVPTQSYAILPSVSNLQANTHRLKFFAYATAIDRTLEVGYLTDASDVNTFVQLQEINLPSTVAANAIEFTIVPGALPAGVKNLCIKNPGFPTGSTTAYLDDFRWEAIPACPEPISLVAGNVLTSSVDLSWTELGTATAWNIEYGLPGFIQGSGTLVSGVTTNNPYTLSSLTPATTYEVYVQSDCGGISGTSPWIGPITFTTSCVAFVAPYTENFDSLALVSPYTDLPNCWESQVGPDFWDVTNDAINTGHTYLPNYGDHTTGTANYMWIDSSSDILANEMVTPLIDMSALTNPVAGFWFASNNVTNTINHSIALDVWDGAAWLNIQTLTGNFTGWVKVSASVPSTVPTITKFRIYAIANPNGTTSDYFYNDLGVDDFFVEEAPANAPVCATNILATPDASCGNEPTVLSWDATPLADGYYITIGTTAGANNVLDNFDLASALTYSFVGTINTTYYYTITPYNSVGLATNCVEQSFTTAVNGCYCFPTGTSSLSYVDNFSTTLASTNITNNASGFSTGNYGDFTNLSLTLGSTQSFDFNVGIVGATVGCAIWIDWDNDLSFDLSDMVYSTTSYGSGPFTGSITIPATTANGNYRMRVLIDYNDSNPGNDDACSFSSGRGEAEDYIITVDNTLSTNSFDDANFVFYPNPVNDILNIFHTSEISSISVVNLIGQSIMLQEINSNNYQLDMSSLNTGVYLVKVKANNTEKTIKITKQ
ncbi:fibronectin type III domain-containing protein [Flavobacterium sp.]|uniref:T9SS type A sorting domain-containing protein n=1 Tax=Flavobacterium sp. TaxID=239 RepID=UPI003F69B210